MNILFISPYGKNLNGGIERWTENILGYYEQQSGLKINLRHCFNPDFRTGYYGSSILKRIRNGMHNYLPLCRMVKKELGTRSYDAVHLCTSASISLIKDLFIIHSAHKYGVKAAVHFHFGRIPELLCNDNWESRLIKKVFKSADRLIVMDKKSETALAGIYGEGKVRYVPNPLSPDAHSIIDSFPDIERDGNKIVFAGHVVRTKGVFELVEACRGINGAELHMLGVIPQAETTRELLSCAGEEADKWLHIRGKLPYETVIKEMKSAAVLVLPSYSEGFPNVIMEGMACACPIVATPVGAIPEMLDFDSTEPCGLCAPVKSVDELRGAIVSMLSDESLAGTLGERARSKVNEQYTINVIWDMLVIVWTGMVNADQN